MTIALCEALDPRDSYDRETTDIFRQLERLEGEALRRILTRLVEVRRDVIDRLTSLPTFTNEDGTATWQANQLRLFRHELEDAIHRFGMQYTAGLADDLTAAANLGKLQMDTLASLAQAVGVPRVVISFGPLGLLDDQIASVILHSSQLIKSVEQSMITAIDRQLQMTVLGGQSRWDTVRAIRDLLATDPRRVNGVRRFGSLTSQAVRIEQTELIRVFNVANEFAIRQAQEELPGIMKEWVTILDSRADPICRGLSGKRAKPGEAFPGGYQRPPDPHPGCRCRLVSFLSDWETDPNPVGAPNRRGVPLVPA